MHDYAIAWLAPLGSLPCCLPALPLPSPPASPQELRHRLAEEVPASSQLRQATPYLGGLGGWSEGRGLPAVLHPGVPA